jgi:methanogenic corrinoid protein MtbC1
MRLQLIAAYNEAIFDTDRAQALQVVQEALDGGASPEEVVFELVVPAMELMIKAISENFDANLAQHFMTAQIAGEVTDMMLQRFATPPRPIGRIVLGTSKGDLHTLGKRIVIGCLRAQMVEAIDLGVNVPPERFVDAAVAHSADVIGISSMMTHTARSPDACLAVRRLLHERGLESRIKIVVGGAPYRFDPELYKTVQADAWAEDGVTASKVIADMIRTVRPS